MTQLEYPAHQAHAAHLDRAHAQRPQSTSHAPRPSSHPRSRSNPSCPPSPPTAHAPTRSRTSRPPCPRSLCPENPCTPRSRTSCPPCSRESRAACHRGQGPPAAHGAPCSRTSSRPPGRQEHDLRWLLFLDTDLLGDTAYAASCMWHFVALMWHSGTAVAHGCGLPRASNDVIPCHYVTSHSEHGSHASPESVSARRADIAASWVLLALPSAIHGARPGSP